MSVFTQVPNEQKNNDEDLKAMDRFGGFTNPFEQRGRNRSLRKLPLYFMIIIMIAPYYWMITSSFKSVKELQSNPPTFWPKKWILGNYYDTRFNPIKFQQDVQQGLFQRFPELKYGFLRFVFNSLFVTITTTFLTLFIGALAAYVISKHRFKGKRVIYLIIIGSMMIPWQVGIIPNFLTIKNLGWINSYWAYIIPALPKAFIVFFLAQYLSGIPDELIEAARIDGANEYRIFWSIVLPLMKPALVAMMILTAIGEWNNFLWPLIITDTQSMYNLPRAIADISNSAQGNLGSQGVLMAAALLTSLPTILLFFFTQRHFVRGIVLSGIK